MDLRFTEEYEDFRAEVRAFLAEHWPPKGDDAKLERVEGQARFRKRAIDAGYLARGIPRKYGGSEQEPDVLRGTIISEEFGRAGAPLDPGPPTAQLVPTLLEPENVIMLRKDQIIERFDTGLSPMPTGMLVTLNEQNILDLLLFLQTKKSQ